MAGAARLFTVPVPVGHFSFGLQVWELLLPQRFKHADGSGIAEIEAPRLRADGDADTAVIVRGEKKSSGRPLVSFAEEQIGPVGVIGLVVAAGRLGGKTGAGRMDVLCKEIVQISYTRTSTRCQ